MIWLLSSCLSAQFPSRVIKVDSEILRFFSNWMVIYFISFTSLRIFALFLDFYNYQGYSISFARHTPQFFNACPQLRSVNLCGAILPLIFIPQEHCFSCSKQSMIQSCGSMLLGACECIVWPKTSSVVDFVAIWNNHYSGPLCGLSINNEEWENTFLQKAE